jgi:hypothetical protein
MAEYQDAKSSVKKSRKIANLTTGLSLLACLFGGIVLLYVANPCWAKNPLYCSELLRDLGIALIVATIIGGILEIYRYAHHRFGAMREMFDMIMSERITPDVWFELKDLIETKVCIRKNVHLRLSITYDEKVPKHLALLSVEYSYEIHSLVRRPKTIEIEHELDYQFKGFRTDLPRFTHFSVDAPKKENDRALDESVKSGKIAFKIQLAGIDARPAHVRISREELVPVPGSYNLYTTEFMKGLTVVIAELPKDVDVDVMIRPQGVGEALRRTGDTWLSDELILPGQGIEVKFLASAKAPPEKKRQEI